MKKLNKGKVLAFKGVLALIVATLMTTLVFIGCKQNAGDEGVSTAKKYKVTLEQTANGNVTVSPTLPTDGMVEEDTVLTFTATADQGFKVGNWEITGVTPQEGGTAGSLTAKIKVTQNVTVKANFTAKAKYRVTVGVLGVERYGTLTTDASNLDQVEEGTIVIFTANPDSEYRSVEKWQVAGADIVNNDENGKVKKTACCRGTWAAL